MTQGILNSVIIYCFRNFAYGFPAQIIISNLTALSLTHEAIIEWKTDLLLIVSFSICYFVRKLYKVTDIQAIEAVEVLCKCFVSRRKMWKQIRKEFKLVNFKLIHNNGGDFAESQVKQNSHISFFP